MPGRPHADIRYQIDRGPPSSPQSPSSPTWCPVLPGTCPALLGGLASWRIVGLIVLGRAWQGDSWSAPPSDMASTMGLCVISVCKASSL